MDSHATDRMATRGPRIRVMTRAERRQIWSMEQKREIVGESLAGGMSVSAVARKHDSYSGLLFTWRRQLLAAVISVSLRRRGSISRVSMSSRRIDVTNPIGPLTAPKPSAVTRPWPR